MLITKRNTFHVLLIALVGLVEHAGLGRAQTASGAKPLEFEVSTVKQASPEERGVMIQLQPGGGLQIKNATLKQLIGFCYDLREFQISGGPGWMSSDHFDIEGKAPAPAVPVEFRTLTDQQRTEFQNQVKERTRSLLAERFQLVAHQETKEMPIYALVLAKGGSKLQTAKEDGSGNQGMRMQRGVLTGTSAKIEMLANNLSFAVGRPVVNRTDLTGKYDWKLEWTTDQGPGQPGGDHDGPGGGPPPDVSGPSLFTALQEQLGLKLDAQKGPAPVLIVERAEKPSAN